MREEKVAVRIPGAYTTSTASVLTREKRSHSWHPFPQLPGSSVRNQRAILLPSGGRCLFHRQIDDWVALVPGLRPFVPTIWKKKIKNK